MSDALAIITGDIWAQQDAFNAVLVDRSVNFEREAGFALQLLQNSDYLVKVAAGNRQSLVNAINNVAALGVSLNPATKLAYLVPRKPRKDQPTQVCLDISYMGLVELAVSCGAILMAQAKIVHENDQTFVDNGPGLAPTHIYDPRSKNRGAPACVFVAAKLPSGDWHTEIMSVEEINKIRDRSESWKSGNSSPWKTDWEEMAKKTVAKRASKWWRGGGNSDRLSNAVHYLNTDGGEGLAAGNVPAGAASLDDNVAEAERCVSEADLTKVYARIMGEYAKASDGTTARAFKQKALAHRAKLRAADTIDMETGAQQ